MTLPTAESCARCDVPYRDHVQQWTPGIGWHGHVPPSKDRIAARIRARLTAAGFLGIDRRHAGMGLPCEVCPGACTIDGPAS